MLATWIAKSPKRCFGSFVCRQVLAHAGGVGAAQGWVPMGFRARGCRQSPRPPHSVHALSQCGPVVNVHIPKDKLTQMHMGFGFVEFKSEEDAQYAIKVLNMIKLFGKPIRMNQVHRARRPPRRPRGDAVPRAPTTPHRCIIYPLPTAPRESC